MLTAAVLGLTLPSPAEAGELDCREDDDCVEYGECAYDVEEDECVVSDEGCRQSELCRDRGRCFASGDECVALRAEDCQLSRRCLDDDECLLLEQGCASTHVKSNPAMFGLGIGVIGLGGGHVVGGAFVMLFAGLAAGVGKLTGNGSDNDLMTVGGVMMGAGAGLAVVVGLPLTIAGGREVSRRNAEVVVGPTGASLRVSF